MSLLSSNQALCDCPEALRHCVVEGSVARLVQATELEVVAARHFQARVERDSEETMRGIISRDEDVVAKRWVEALHHRVLEVSSHHRRVDPTGMRGVHDDARAMQTERELA